MAPTRGHVARVPDAREQLKVAQTGGGEGVHEMGDAFVVVVDGDEDEGGEAGHRDAVARAVPLGFTLVLCDFDMEVREVRGVGEDTKEFFDVGGSVSAAEGQLRELGPRQRPVAIRHRPSGYLQLLQTGHKLGAERRPGSTLRRDLELFEGWQLTAHKGVEVVPVSRGCGEMDKYGTPALCIVCDDAAEWAEKWDGDVVCQKVVP